MEEQASSSQGFGKSHPQPLNRVRVIDLSRLLPGPLCTQILVDLGAEVIKIEDEVGDYLRYYQPVMGDGTSALFHAINRGKVGYLG